MQASKPLFLGDIRPGMRLPLPGFDCSAELVAGYADLLDARHPIHVDPEYAKTTRYGRLIAHGPLVIAKVLAELNGVFGSALQVMLDVGEWRFYGPVFVGDGISARPDLPGDHESCFAGATFLSSFATPDQFRRR